MKELKESNFLLNLINNQILIITLPELFILSDLENMNVKNNSINFIFNKEKCINLKSNSYELIINNKDILNFLENKNSIKNSKIYIVDIEEIKKRNNGVHFLYS